MHFDVRNEIVQNLLALAKCIHISQFLNEGKSNFWEQKYT